MRGRKHVEELERITITLPKSALRRLDELQLLMRLSRSEVIGYLIDREAERRMQDITRNREFRSRHFVVNEKEV